MDEEHEGAEPQDKTTDRKVSVKAEGNIITVWLNHKAEHKGSSTSHVYTKNEAKELIKKLGVVL